jgi:radical SAM protein with 4Fe4S-binding SPASM domain
MADRVRGDRDQGSEFLGAEESIVDRERRRGRTLLRNTFDSKSGKLGQMKSSKRFTKVNVEITNICNLQCSFCPEVIRPKGLIELSLFRRILDEISPLTDEVTLHLMGEPLLHPHLEELVELCHHRGIRIFLVSNGVLLRESFTATLLHPAFRQVNFSLHSFFDNFKEEDPSVYLERIFAFTDQAFERRPDLYLNYRLWNLAAAKSSVSNNQTLLQRIGARFGVGIPPGVDVRVQKSYPIKNRLYLHFDTEFQWPSLDLPVLGTTGTCYGLSSHFGILIDGTVVPCCLDKEGKIPLGNIKDEPIQVILEKERARAMLQGFRDRKLVEDLCQRCQYIERFSRFTQ